MNTRFGRLVTKGACLTACLVILSACGYRMAGSGNLPGDLEHIAVHVFKNRTSETGLETIFTNALVNEFNSRRPGTLVGDEQAPAYLDGSIVSLGSRTIARSGSVTALERRLSAVMSVNLVSKKGQVIWQSGPIRGEETYQVSGGDSGLDINRRRALIQLAERMAEETFLRLTIDF